MLVAHLPIIPHGTLQSGAVVRVQLATVIEQTVSGECRHFGGFGSGTKWQTTFEKSFDSPRTFYEEGDHRDLNSAMCTLGTRRARRALTDCHVPT
jgi:hypothetical protein